MSARRQTQVQREDTPKKPAAGVLQEDCSEAADATTGPAGSASGTVARFLALAFALLVLLVLRRPDAVLNAQFWAEDGLVYYSQAFADGPSSLFHPFNGTLWTLPRFLALAITLLPVLWAPFVFNLVALAIDAACCALLSLPCYRHLLRSDWLRVGCCVLFATALTTGQEMIGTLTNMPHYLTLAAVGMMALRFETIGNIRGRNVGLMAIGALLCATSSPVIIAVGPIALWQIYQSVRNRHSKMLAISASLLAGILIQVAVAVGFRDAANSQTPAFFPNLPMAMLFIGILRWLLGDGLARDLAVHFMLPTAGVAIILIALWAVLLRKLKTAYLLSASVLFVGPVAMATIWRHLLWTTWTQVLLWSGDRYFLLPGCVFIFVAAASLETLPKFRYSLLTMALLFALGIAGNFRVSPYPNFNWPSEALQVRQWLSTGRGVEVLIPPGPPWVVRLPNLSGAAEDTLRISAALRVSPAKSEQVGPLVHVAKWQSDPAWTQNGFHASVGALAGETLWGSYSGSDANRGTLTSAPFDTSRRGCIILPIAHGPSTGGQSVRLVAADNEEDLGSVRLDEETGSWRYWAVYFSREIPSIRIVASDQGDQWGQWVAVGDPHSCR